MKKTRALYQSIFVIFLAILFFEQDCVALDFTDLKTLRLEHVAQKQNFLVNHRQGLLTKEVALTSAKETPDEVAFVVFYKDEVRDSLDFDSLLDLAQSMAHKLIYNIDPKAKIEEEIEEEGEVVVEGKKQVTKKKLRIQFIPLKYKRQTKYFYEDYATPANALYQKLNSLNLFGQKKKIIIYTVSGSMGSVAHLTKNDGVPENAIHSVIALDPHTQPTPLHEKIEHRLYSFYGGNKNDRIFKPPVFDSKNSQSKIINVRCLYEKIKPQKVTSQSEQQKYEIVDVASMKPSDQKQNQKQNQALSKLIKKIDTGYPINNDLAAILFSERNDYWKLAGQDLLPLAFYNKKTLNVGSMFGPDQNIKSLEKKLTLDLSTNKESLKTVFDHVSLLKNRTLRDLFGGEGITSYYYRASKRALGLAFHYTLGQVLRRIPGIGKHLNALLPINPYYPEKKIIGPFFIPQNDKIFLTLLVEREAAPKVRIKIGENNPKEFGIQLPFKHSFVALKEDITNHIRRIGKSYQITGVEGEQLDGKLPIEQSRYDNFNFIVYGDLRSDKPTERLDDTSVALKTTEILKVEESKFHLLTGDLIIDGSSTNLWSEFLERVLSPLSKNILVTSAVGNHDIVSNMGYHGTNRYYFNEAVPHFANMFNLETIASGDKGSNVLTSDEHTEATHNSFDVGSIRFIHLPLPTEEVYGHYSEKVGADGSFVKTYTKAAKQVIAGMTCSNFKDIIWQRFEDNVKKAVEYKSLNPDKLKFIIVFGHAPLATAPQYKVPHPGFFNSMIKNKPKKRSLVSRERQKYNFTKNILRIFRDNPINAYFCGHNHLYDNCSVTIKQSNGEKKIIPMITMGIGTHLKAQKASVEAPTLGDKKDKLNITSNQFISRNKASGRIKELVGYIKCEVDNLYKTIDCNLVSHQEIFDGIISNKRKLGKKDSLKKYDSFTIKSDIEKVSQTTAKADITTKTKPTKNKNKQAYS